VEAIRLKYASELVNTISSCESVSDNHDEIIRIGGKEVEEVGFDKIRTEMADLQALRIVILDSLRVSRPQLRKLHQSYTRDAVEQDTGQDVLKASPNIVELDLSRNLFEDWDEITDICRQLYNLRSLKVDGNRFQNIGNPSTDIALTSPPFALLKTLSLDSTLLSWEQVCTHAQVLVCALVKTEIGHVDCFNVTKPHIALCSW